MAVAVAALLDRRTAVQALRKALPRVDWQLFVARSPSHLVTLLYRHPLDVIVLGGDVARGPVLAMWREHFPAIPVVAYLAVRGDDADFLTTMRRDGVDAMAIEGLDEPALPRILARHSLTAHRLADLVPLAGRIDLVDDLQRRAWREIVATAGQRAATASLARRLGIQRETLSRRFGAGRAPALKRAIDAARLVVVSRLLENPGYSLEDVARLAGFSSVSNLQACARRTFGTSAGRLRELRVDEVPERLVGDWSPGWD
ncbi:MAG: helix-turn-helix domain-containing protein [Gemmatimonadales bacterium]